MLSHYKILGLSDGASLNEVKQAYRKLVLRHHPDKNEGSKESELRFKQISEAYQELLQYSEHRPKGGKPEFEKEDTEIDISLTLEQIINGVKGFEVTRRQRLLCKNCLDQCATCDGFSKMTITTSYIDIPKGIISSCPNILRVKNAGDQNSDGSFNDLIIVYNVIEHDVFKLKEGKPGSLVDLLATMPINMIEYIKTGKLVLVFFDKKLKISPTPEQIISGVRIKGWGLPGMEEGTIGDLHIKFKLALPKPDTLTSKEHKLLEMLLNSRNFKTNKV